MADVTTFNQKNLHYFVDTVVPQHIHVLKSITFSQLAYSNFSVRSSVEDFIKSADSDASDSDASDSDASDSDASDQHDLLLTRLFASLPKLVTVELIFYRLPPKFGNHAVDRDRKKINDGIPKSRYSGCEPPQALAAVGDRVERLVFVGDARFPNPGLSRARLASFLSHFPFLSTLCLEFDLTSKERETLQSTIASLCRLKNLVVKGNHLFGDSSATTSWACPLETLSIATQEPIPLSSLINLLGHFSTTLASLGICMARYLTPVDPALLATLFRIQRVRSLNLDIFEPAFSLLVSPAVHSNTLRSAAATSSLRTSGRCSSSCTLAR